MNNKIDCRTNIRVAVLIDGAFFLKRYRSIFPSGKKHSPEIVVKNLYTLAHSHVNENYLYRIFYYDSVPFDKIVHNPINKKSINFSTTPEAIFRNEFYEHLKKQRKLALRLGHLADSQRFNWSIRPNKLKQLLNKQITVDDLQENDVYYNLKQKGVDIRIGLDIASLAYKQLVDKIVLISGDSDFVPAAKAARREGIDFVLDPLWNPIDQSLHEHIDGLKSIWKKPKYLIGEKLVTKRKSK